MAAWPASSEKRATKKPLSDPAGQEGRFVYGKKSAVRGVLMEKYREPLRSLVGKFEAIVAGEPHARNTSRDYANSLWKYFSRFPRKNAPEQFALADTEDWREWRREDGAAYSTIRKELCVVRAFFSWLVATQPAYSDLPIPVVIPPWPEKVSSL